MREGLANWRVQVPLAACLLLVGLLAFLVFRYFLLTFTVAGSVALILAPVQRRLTRKLGGYSSAAAGLLVLGCTVVLLLPLIFFGVIFVFVDTEVVQFRASLSMLVVEIAVVVQFLVVGTEL